MITDYPNNISFECIPLSDSDSQNDHYNTIYKPLFIITAAL